jgi:hypothetical protein
MFQRAHLSVCWNLLAFGAVLVRWASAEEPQERRREERLDDGTRIVHVTRMFALSSERFVYAPDGSFKSHVGRESHPNGRLVCRRSNDEHGVLLAFQTYTYDREWRPRAVRTFNARGQLVLLAESEPVNGTDTDSKTTFYSSDAPGRRVIELGSREYVQIVRDHHLEAFQ